MANEFPSNNSCDGAQSGTQRYTINNNRNINYNYINNYQSTIKKKNAQPLGLYGNANSSIKS